MVYNTNKNKGYRPWADYKPCSPTLPTNPGGIFGTMIYLYLMVCSIQEKMIAKLCWGFKELLAFKIRYHLNNCQYI